MSFGERIRALRKQRQLTQQETADRIGVVRNSYANYEGNLREPDFRTLVRIADLFGVTTDFLLGRTGNEGGAGESREDIHLDDAAYHVEKVYGISSPDAIEGLKRLIKDTIEEVEKSKQGNKE